MVYRLAIFDFDGTLVDSTAGVSVVLKQIVEEYGLAVTVLEEWRRMIGMPLQRQLELLIPDRSENFREAVACRCRALSEEKVLATCPLFFGVTNTVTSLRQAGIAMSIVSSRHRNQIEAVLNHHQLASYFGLVIGSEDVVKHKPDPEAVYFALKNLGVQPQHAVVVGDSSYDLEMARNAGVDAIGITTGTHEQDTLERAQPKYLVDRLEEVVAIILGSQTIEAPARSSTEER
jgi:phosphoglycolate phosphatase